MKNSKYILLGIAAVVCAVVLARAYTYKYRSQDTIVVTGLGETEFSSDLIVWSGTLTAEAQNVAAGYAEIEQSKQKVQKYLEDKGIPAAAVVFEFVNVDKQYTPVYNAGPDNVSRGTSCASASRWSRRTWRRWKPSRAKYRR